MPVATAPSPLGSPPLPSALTSSGGWRPPATHRRFGALPQPATLGGVLAARPLRQRVGAGLLGNAPQQDYLFGGILGDGRPKAGGDFGASNPVVSFSPIFQTLAANPWNS